MILLVPLRAETEIPQVPRVTVALISLSVLVFLFTSMTDTRGMGEEEAKLERIADWTLRKAAHDRPALEAARARFPSALGFLEREPAWRALVGDTAAAATLQGCLEDFGDIVRRDPFHQWGFVPARVTALGLITHQFLHADLLHLAFNMLFLWVVGGVLEATFGGPCLAGGYLLSGVAAALAHALSAPGSTEPAIGSSGAVAGLMGAFAVTHGKEPIRVAMVVMLAVAPRIRLLSVPAAVLFGLWLLEQLFYALMKAPLGIAFWAHVGGFAFGAAGAVVLGRTLTPTG